MGKICPLCRKDYSFSSLILSCPLGHCPRCGLTQVKSPSLEEVSDSFIKSLKYVAAAGITVGLVAGISVILFRAPTYSVYAVGLAGDVTFIAGILVVLVTSIVSLAYYSRSSCTTCGSKFFVSKKDIPLVSTGTDTEIW